MLLNSRFVFWSLLPVYLFFTECAFSYDAVNIAAAQIDANPQKKYVLGRNGPDEFDCSGLTWYTFGSIGIELPLQAVSQSTMSQGEQLTSPTVSELQRGDLLFFETNDELPGVVTHVGIYEGDGMMLNAQSDISIPNLKRADVTSSYWSTRLLSAKRLPSHEGTPSSKFVLGEVIKVNQDDVSVRRLRQADALGKRNMGDTGSVIFGPVKASVNGNSYWWWKVDFESGPDGWVAENFLQSSGVPVYGFTPWLSDVEYQAEFNRQLAGSYYPLEVEGRNFNGESQYRGKFVPFPPSSFYFYSIHGHTQASYESLNSDLLSQGYKQIFLQTFVDQDGITRYQATWTAQ